jgi:hypothetical protein
MYTITQEIFMGGAQKSMMHPYDNLELTFGQWLDISQDLFIVGKFREKMDGCNLTWRYDADEDQVYIARNVTSMAEGGQKLEDYEASLATHPAKDQFIKGVRMIQRIQPKIRFMKDWPAWRKAWFNCEVIDSESPQTLRYQSDCLIVHENCMYDPDTNRSVPINITDLHHFASRVSEPDWPVYHEVTLDLNGEPEDLFEWMAFVHEEMRKFNLVRENTISDYVSLKLYHHLVDMNLKIDQLDLFEAALSVTGKAKFNLRQWTNRNKGLDNDTIQSFRNLALSANRLKNINFALRDLKKHWLKLGAKVLQYCVSELVSDAEFAEKRLRNMIRYNRGGIEEYKNSHSRQYQNFLMEYDRWLSYGVVPQQVEGIVIFHETGIYKVTGAYQAMNRVCGTLRYEFNDKWQEPQEVK